MNRNSQYAIRNTPDGCEETTRLPGVSRIAYSASPIAPTVLALDSGEVT